MTEHPHKHHDCCQSGRKNSSEQPSLLWGEGEARSEERGHHSTSHCQFNEQVMRCMVHLEDKVDSLVCVARTLLEKVDSLMALSAELQDMLKKIDTQTTEVGEIVKGLFERLKNTSLSDAEKTEVFAQADAVVAHLTAIGKDPNAPVPPLTGVLAHKR